MAVFKNGINGEIVSHKVYDVAMVLEKHFGNTWEYYTDIAEEILQTVKNRTEHPTG